MGALSRPGGRPCAALVTPALLVIPIQFVKMLIVQCRSKNTIIKIKKPIFKFYNIRFLKYC